MRQSFTYFVIIVPLLLFTACFKQWGESKKSNEISYDLSRALHEENVVPIAIIGSGPAGLTSALYVARAGLTAFVFAGPHPRGQLMETTYIDNWPSRAHVLGHELMADMEKQVIDCGGDIIHDTITSIDFDVWPFAIKTEDGKKFKALAVILATGSKARRLNVPGEEQYFGKGVSTCAVCDACFYKGKDVIVVGGGDSAAEMACELAVHAKNVTILVRKQSMRAAISMQKRLRSFANIAIEYHKEVKEIYGDGKLVTAVEIADTQTYDAAKRSIDGIFLAVGHDPNNKLFQNALKSDEHGYLVMQERSQKTSLPGVYAAGEIQDHVYRQAIVASGEGAKAALDAISFLYDLGFNTSVGEQLDKKFFESFSDTEFEISDLKQRQELDDRVLHAQGVVLLDFYTDECPGCMHMMPILRDVCYKLSDKLKIYKVKYKPSDMNEPSIYRALWNHHDIKVRRLPTLLVFKDGKFMDMSTQLMTKSQLYDYLNKFL